MTSMLMAVKCDSRPKTMEAVLRGTRNTANKNSNTSRNMSKRKAQKQNFAFFLHNKMLTNGNTRTHAAKALSNVQQLYIIHRQKKQTNTLFTSFTLYKYVPFFQLYALTITNAWSENSSQKNSNLEFRLKLPLLKKQFKLIATVTSAINTEWKFNYF